MNITKQIQEIKEIIKDYESSNDFPLYRFKKLVTERIPDGDVSDFVRSELLDKTPAIQAEVLSLFAKAGHREVLEFIEPLSFLTEWFIKLNSATALAHLGEERGFRLLEDIAFSQSETEASSNFIPVDWVLEKLEEISNERARELEAKIRNYGKESLMNRQ